MLKQKILETAHDIFYQHGFHACGVELLAREAGTTKRTLYAHFGSKDRLIEAVLNYQNEQFIKRLKKHLDNTKPEACIKGYLEFIQAWIQSKNFYGCIFINACGECSDEAHAPYQIAQAHKQQIRHYLQQQLNHEMVAELLFLYGEGLIVTAQTGMTELSRSVDTLTDLLIKQLTV